VRVSRCAPPRDVRSFPTRRSSDLQYIRCGGALAAHVDAMQDGTLCKRRKPESSIAMIYLALAFLLVAFLYASVGFGGGSTYTALLIESGLDWTLVPPISLMCNIVVVAGGVYHFAKAGHIDLRLAMPLIVASIPAAFLGGYARLSEASFLLVLGTARRIAGG